MGIIFKNATMKKFVINWINSKASCVYFMSFAREICSRTGDCLGGKKNQVEPTIFTISNVLKAPAVSRV